MEFQAQAAALHPTAAWVGGGRLAADVRSDAVVGGIARTRVGHLTFVPTWKLEEVREKAWAVCLSLRCGLWRLEAPRESNYVRHMTIMPMCELEGVCKGTCVI